jgi:hypothetical protein
VQCINLGRPHPHKENKTNGIKTEGVVTTCAPRLVATTNKTKPKGIVTPKTAIATYRHIQNKKIKSSPEEIRTLISRSEYQRQFCSHFSCFVGRGNPSNQPLMIPTGVLFVAV